MSTEGSTTHDSSADIAAEIKQRRAALKHARRWVVKIGSALATNQGVGLNLSAIQGWAGQIVKLARAGHEIVVVTSGSVAEGAVRLGWEKRPHAVNQLQAAAAIGQMGLMRGWDQAFEHFGSQAAQVLLTHDDLADRQRYLNSRSTLWTLLELGVVPVVNENDTVATAEISLGDNDTLAGLVSNLIEADLLVILTDQEGMFDADPRKNPSARLIRDARVDDPGLAAMAGAGGAWGRGGMQTTLGAARLAARSATPTIIASGWRDQVLSDIAAGADHGTLLYSHREKINARKQWLAGSLRPRGSLIVDTGAARALQRDGKSLLAVGVTGVDGLFSRGELVLLKAQGGEVLGRGLVNYSAEECRRIAGLASDRIEAELGLVREPEVIHRDNLLVEPVV